MPEWCVLPEQQLCISEMKIKFAFVLRRNMNIKQASKHLRSKVGIKAFTFQKATAQKVFYLFIFFFFCLFTISWAIPTAYGGSQARGRIGAVATSLGQSHSNAGSEQRLRLTPQLTATPDP